MASSINLDDPGMQSSSATVSGDIAKEVSIYGLDGSTVRGVVVDSAGRLDTVHSQTATPAYIKLVESITLSANTISVRQVDAATVSVNNQPTGSGFYTVADTAVTILASDIINTSHRSDVSAPEAGTRSIYGKYLINVKNAATVSVRMDVYIRSTLSGAVADSKLTELTVTLSGNGSLLTDHLFASPQGITLDFVNLVANGAGAGTIGYNIVSLKD